MGKGQLSGNTVKRRALRRRLAALAYRGRLVPAGVLSFAGGVLTVAGGPWEWWSMTAILLCAAVFVFDPRPPYGTVVVAPLLAVASGAIPFAWCATYLLASSGRRWGLAVIGGAFLIAGVLIPVTVGVLSGDSSAGNAGAHRWTLVAGTITAAIVGWFTRRQVAAYRHTPDDAHRVEDLITVLHDQIGHRLALLNMYAATLARRTVLTAPEQERVVEAIQCNVQEAARTLATLLTDGPVSTQTPLKDLDALVSDFRSAGFPVYEHRGDEVDQLDHDSLLFLLAFARECLTNAAKHGAVCFIYLHAVYAAASGHLIVSCCSSPISPPPAARAASSGLGLAALAEQAELRGGSLEVRAEATRFVVTAVVKARRPTGHPRAHAPKRKHHVSHS